MIDDKFYQCISKFEKEKMPSDLKVMKDLHELIEHSFREMRDPYFYSHKLNVSEFRLNFLCKIYFGVTLYGRVQFRIHEEAIKLLKYTSLTAKEIAYELGMNDPSYFGRCFKRITGMSPMCFREKFKEITE